MIVRENGRLLVPVAVNGKKESRFLFDTGATTSVLSEKLAAKAGVTPKSIKRVSTFAGVVSLPVGQVDTLRIGHRSVVGIEVIVADLAGLFRPRCGNRWNSGSGCPLPVQLPARSPQGEARDRRRRKSLVQAIGQPGRLRKAWREDLRPGSGRTCPSDARFRQPLPGGLRGRSVEASSRREYQG